jgi:hypothetical protein
MARLKISPIARYWTKACHLNSTSSENEIIVSDLRDFEDVFDFCFDDFQYDGSDVDVDSEDDDGQEINCDWDGYEENDDNSEKQRQDLFKVSLHWAVVRNVSRSSVDKLLSVLRSEQHFSFLTKSSKNLLGN